MATGIERGSARTTSVSRQLAAPTASLTARGNHNSTVVPRPASLISRNVPRPSVTRVCAMARPKPVPRPIGLVVKNGSAARANVALSIIFRSHRQRAALLTSAARGSVFGDRLGRKTGVSAEQKNSGSGRGECFGHTPPLVARRRLQTSVLQVRSTCVAASRPRRL